MTLPRITIAINYHLFLLRPLLCYPLLLLSLLGLQLRNRRENTAFKVFSLKKYDISGNLVVPLGKVEVHEKVALEAALCVGGRGRSSRGHFADAGLWVHWKKKPKESHKVLLLPGISFPIAIQTCFLKLSLFFSSFALPLAKGLPPPFSEDDILSRFSSK